ncbi:MAG: hypothetical protein EP319_07725 [Deltaproteobacteria bacterium]|nr:MAG: hypothetical protein EP319_07725 [Deltaproteobacteria bacterium]
MMILNFWEELPNKLKLLVANIAVAIMYFVTAKIGLLLAFEHNQVSPLWPPSGLAVASIFLFRNKLVPGILLGATIANMIQILGAGQTLSLAVAPGLLIGIGNTLEAWIGVNLYKKLVNDEFIFNKIKTIIYYALLCGVLGCLVPALIGVSILTLFDLAPKDIFMKLMLTWWIGDLGGVLVIAPAFIVLRRYFVKFKSLPFFMEFASYLIALSLLSYVVFHTTLKEGNVIGPSLIYLVIPLIVVTAIRIGNIGVGLVNGAVALFATMGTVNGLGPFSSNPNTTVLLLNIFLASNYLIGFTISSLWNNLRIARLEVLQNAKMAGLGEVASILAHELGNPIHMIMNYAEIIKMDSERDGNYSEKTLRAVDKILDYSERTQQIIKSNRNFYQNHKLDIQKINVKESLLKVRELLSIKLIKSNTELLIDDVDCFIEGDPLHIEQAFYNIINNSLDAFLLDPDLEEGNRVKVKIRAHDGVVDLSVVDNGPGIPEDFIDKIFTPFVTKNKTGLGLSLVASIISAHDGEVSAFNNDGRGITMKLRLPTIV